VTSLCAGSRCAPGILRGAWRKGQPEPAGSPESIRVEIGTLAEAVGDRLRADALAVARRWHVAGAPPWARSRRAIERSERKRTCVTPAKRNSTAIRRAQALQHGPCRLCPLKRFHAARRSRTRAAGIRQSPGRGHRGPIGAGNYVDAPCWGRIVRRPLPTASPMGAGDREPCAGSPFLVQPAPLAGTP